MTARHGSPNNALVIIGSPIALPETWIIPSWGLPQAVRGSLALSRPLPRSRDTPHRTNALNNARSAPGTRTSHFAIGPACGRTTLLKSDLKEEILLQELLKGLPRGL